MTLEDVILEGDYSNLHEFDLYTNSRDTEESEDIGYDYIGKVGDIGFMYMESPIIEFRGPAKVIVLGED